MTELINVNKKVKRIAIICHEANRILQITNGEEPNPRWENLPNDLKNSTYMGVLEAMDGKNARDLHHSWMEERLSQGWVYGKVLDREKKIHPNLVPYDHLPFEQQAKDSMFFSIVAAYLMGDLV